MKIKLIMFLLLCVSSFAQTQPSFTWSKEASSIENETEYKIENVLESDRLFRVKSKYNDKVFNTDVFVDIFDSKDDFEKDDTNTISVEQPVMGLNMLTLNSMFQVKGKEYVYFLTEYNRTSRENELFFQKVNIDTKTKTRTQLTTKMPGKNGSNPGEFYVAQSENKMFYVILKQPSYDKKVNEKVMLCLLDDKFKVVKEIEYEFPFSSKQSGDQTLFVSNTGNVFMLKNIDLPKAKPYMGLYFWDSKANTVTEKSLKLEQDFLQINQFKGKFINDDFYLQGFYSDSARFFSISYGVSSPSTGIFGSKFNALTGEMNYFTYNATNRYKNFYIKDILFDGNKSWMIFDQVYKETKRLPLPPGSASFDFKYEYKYDSVGLTVAMLDITSGKLDWITDIKNDEPSTLNDNGNFVSSLYFLKNNKLSLIYNDTRDLNTGAVHVPYNSRIPVLQTIDAQGKTIERMDLTNAGVGNTKKHCFELDTSFKVQTADGSYIVRAKCGNSAWYGFLTL
ncbi:hypothetical protein [Flavobacterium sp.]|uniref:hypothetical protein n=1 Tax=Flavobacterium sp. TaxID=239 RepID=UPI0037507777